MAPSHKNFDTKTKPKPSSGSFSLGGRTWHCRAYDDVSVGVVDLILQKKQIPTARFFEAMLMPDEVDDFLSMMGQANGTLTLGKVGEVMEFVAEKVLNRPTSPAVDSSTGSTPTGRKSAAGSSSQATPRRRSA